MSADLEAAWEAGALVRRAAADPEARARVVVVAAHPDDETIGMGAALSCLPGVVVVHTTDGAPRDARLRPAMAGEEREAYARARRAEVRGALELAGISADRILSLGAVDQEAALDMASIALRLADLFGALRPALVITHPYEGGHPDHDATALAVHAAAALLRRRRHAECPPLAEMSSYHAAGGRFTAFAFLSPCDATAARDTPGWSRTRALSRAERARKRAMLDRFKTQRAVLDAFPVVIERARSAPAYDFTQAPHAGPLYYERLGFPLSGARWRRLASLALASLDLHGLAL